MAKLRDKARAVLNSDVYPALSAIFAKGRITPKPNVIGLILARRKQGAKLTEKEMSILRNLSDFDGAALRRDYTGGGNNPMIGAILDRIYARQGEGQMPNVMADGLIPGVTTASEMWEKVGQELRALANGKSLVDSLDDPNHEWTDAEIEAELAKNAPKNPVTIHDARWEAEQAFGADSLMVKKIDVVNEFADRFDEETMPHVLAAIYAEIGRMQMEVVSAKEWQKRTEAFSRHSAIFQVFLDTHTPEAMRQKLTDLPVADPGNMVLASSPAPKSPHDPITSPTGHLDWAVFTAWDAKESGGRIEALPIRVLKGAHWTANNGFGKVHIVEEHADDINELNVGIDSFIHHTLLDFNDVYKDGNRLTLMSARPSSVAVVEVAKGDGGFYTVITAFPKKNPSWKPRGVRILGGRRAALAQSVNAPARTAQGILEPKPPLETLAGKDTWEYLASLRQPVKQQNDGIGLQSPPAPETPGRFRPKSLVEFKKPYRGPSGAALTAYEWKYKLEDGVDRRGEDKVSRVSNWDEAETNRQTGHEIVHHFHVDMPDGKSYVVSLESALKMMGYTQANGQKSGPVRTLASMLRTRAKLSMQADALRPIVEEKIAINQRYQQERAALRNTPMPEPVFSIGDNGPKMHSADGYLERFGPWATKENYEATNARDLRDMADRWRDREAARRAGGNGFGNEASDLSDIEARIAKMDRKIQAQSATGADTPVTTEAPATATGDLFAALVDTPGDLAKFKENAQAAFDAQPESSPARDRIAEQVLTREGVRKPGGFVGQAQRSFDFGVSGSLGTKDQPGFSLMSSAAPGQRSFDFGTSGSFSTRNQTGFDFGAKPAVKESSTAQPAAEVSNDTNPPMPGTPEFRALPQEAKMAAVKAITKRKQAEREGTITDFGAKIGGARKDLAIKTGPTGKKAVDERPAWARRYEISEIVKSDDESEPGRFVIRDLRDTDWRGQPRQATRETFSTRGEAENAVKLLAVARNHDVRMERVKDQPTMTPAQADAMIAKDAAAREADTKHPGYWSYAMIESAKKRLAEGAITQDIFDKLQAAHGANAATFKPAERAPTPEAAYTYTIWRKVSDRKRVQVVAREFTTREEAMKYMAEHAEEIIETKTSWREELIAKPEKAVRTGPERRKGPATAEMFQTTFGFRGVEFGKWLRQQGDGKERQEVLNHAYDGLLDLAELLGIPPRAISLNGELGLAFGARGQGLQGAKAHYELDYAVINLTKMSGAGSLAHEWFHSLDHYLARQDGKAAGEMVKNTDGDMVFKAKGSENDMVSHGFGRQSKVREAVMAAYQHVVGTIFTKAVQYVEDSQQAEKFVADSRQRLADNLAKLRKDLQRAPYVSDNYKERRKPATETQLAEFDTLAERMLNGEGLKMEFRTIEGGKAKYGTHRHTNDTLEALNVLHKAVTGHSGFRSERNGALDNLGGYMTRYKERIAMLESAAKTETKSKAVPTSYAMESKKIDQGSAKDYWTTPHEMAARAFSAYVEDRISDSGGKSDFLSYGSDNSLPWYRQWNLKPFPEGAERVAINDAFDKLFQTLETRETDRGMALMSSPAPESPESARHAELEAKHDAGTITPEETAEAERIVAERAKAAGGKKVFHGTNATRYVEAAEPPPNEAAKSGLREIAAKNGLSEK